MVISESVMKGDPRTLAISSLEHNQSRLEHTQRVPLAIILKKKKKKVESDRSSDTLEHSHRRCILLEDKLI